MSVIDGVLDDGPIDDMGAANSPLVSRSLQGHCHLQHYLRHVR
jgi:hypothetical protein